MRSATWKLSLQTRLLRVLQDREFERIGGTKTLRMDARVIAATNRDLKAEVRAGRFREDLYYRLNVLGILLPSLREHASDIPLLVKRTLPRICNEANIPVPAVTDAFMARMSNHPWRGNVRELANVVESVTIQHLGQTLDSRHLDGILDDEEPVPSYEGKAEPLIEPRAFDCDVAPDSDGSGPRSCYKQSQPSTSEIAAVLRSTGGNMARASRRMNVPRSTLRYWVSQHKLSTLIPKD